MIGSLLIANRGEIARRIIRTACRLGVRTIAVYSDADADLPFVREADEAVRLGPAPARESYLAAGRILEAARATGAEAIHPGYGFLSEDAAFAEAVLAAGLTWVGPPPAAIRAMGRKDAAKRLMQQAGVPVTPGYLGEDQSPGRLAQEAAAIGFPVLIKAVAGGGGRGMRRVESPSGFAAALDACRREAVAAFGDDRVLLERYVTGPRHIEVQVFGDRHGDVVHLFERDCSLQRRHQKVIEEAPAPGLDAATRETLCAAAVRAARAVGYVGAGTVEFIADASEGLRADRIWFMEMNTRLQVEHPVTEAITGVDLVEWQLRVASGEPLPLRQADIAIAGWAMEARLYAEDPAAGFLPSVGRLDHLRLPTSLRVDSGVEQGSAVSPHYDPMIAKLIAHGPTRAAAGAALTRACAEVEVWPVKTNAAFLARLVADPAFRAGTVDTGFIDCHAGRLATDAEPPPGALQAAARALVARDASQPWSALTGFRVAAEPEPQVVLRIAGATRTIALRDATPTGRVVDLPDGGRVLFGDGEAWAFGQPTADDSAQGAGPTSGAVLSPMPGRIAAVDVREGDTVAQGQRLLVVEAMKMELALNAPSAGRVIGLAAKVGDQIREGTVLATIEPGGSA